jgi:energy-coupling factor transporter ATP-binding protein EcfA2
VPLPPVELGFDPHTVLALTLAVEEGVSVLVVGAAGSGRSAWVRHLSGHVSGARALAGRDFDDTDTNLPLPALDLTQAQHQPGPLVVPDANSPSAQAAVKDLLRSGHQAVVAARTWRGQDARTVAAPSWFPPRTPWLLLVLERDGFTFTAEVTRTGLPWDPRAFLASRVSAIELETALVLLPGFTGTYVELLEVATQL